MMNLFHSTVFTTLLACSTHTVLAQPSAQTLLEDATRAAKTLNYDGVFALQNSQNLESIRIIHRADQTGETERLIALNGDEREFIRNNEQVMCLYPEGKHPQAGRQPLGKGFPVDLLNRINLASPFYTSLLSHDGRVAGHQAQLLQVDPIDDFRYGYRLWLEKETRLLLQAELVNQNQRVLEKFAFSSIKIGDQIEPSLLNPGMQGNKLVWKRKGNKIRVNPMVSKNSKWHVDWLPQGFDLIGQQQRFARNGAPVEQRVYSDGLSSISVFIEKMRARHSHLHGGSNMGAINAFGTITHAHFVTVVGEVPAITVEKVGQSIRHRQ